jgi:methyltransferase (TIGR00027 family)
MNAAPILSNISDTAHWVAYYRALESERPDALFRDPFARRLAGERGREMGARMAKRALPWAIAVRTRVFDELLLDAIERDGASAVVNLAAGMDTRPYRLALPAALEWVELDLPDIIQWKNMELAAERAACTVERIGVNVADRRALGEVLDRVSRRHSSVVVVTEGLLAYLDEGSVRGLARELHARPTVRSWVLESALPEVIERNQRAWGKHFQKAGAAMKFAPPNGLAYYHDQGWSVRTQRACLLEARRLGRGPRFGGLLHWLKSRTASGREWLQNVVVYGTLERAGPSPT